MLTFKTKKDTDSARWSAEEWVPLVKLNAITLQHHYAVVAHNVPAEIWDGVAETMEDAIEIIEVNNNDVMVIDFSIKKLTWLNSHNARGTMGHGPLMVSFTNWDSANSAIEHCMSFNEELCNVSIFIPRAPQCF